MATEIVSFMASDPNSVLVSNPPKTRLMQRAGFRQLIKFCLVGASSTVIDVGLLFFLTKRLMVLSSLPWVPWFTWNTLTFCLAVTNGFIWNRRWTFRAQIHGAAREQYVKFFVTNSVGLVLSLFLTKLFLMMLFGHAVLGENNPDPNHLMIAKICAIPFVMIWNFSAAKFWTFKAPKNQIAVSDD